MKKIFLMLTVFAAGNCFAQTNQNCFSVPLSLNEDTKEVTVDKSPINTTKEKEYVYCDWRKNRKSPMPAEYADLTDPKASRPILVNCTKNMQAVTQTYKVSVSGPQDNLKVCPDLPVTLSTDINVEKEADYTGYYPSTVKNNYKEVSRRVYRKTARNMRNAKRKEEKMARLTGLHVEGPTENG